VTFEDSDSTVEIIRPGWQVADKVRAFTTTRQGGVSAAPWDSFNLATHVNDSEDDVKQNRDRLIQNFNLPAEPVWLQQTHSDSIVSLTKNNLSGHFKADAAYTTETNIVCCVMTADCLPVLFCNKQANWVAAVHAGWKGIANGILKKTLDTFCEIDGANKLQDLNVWIGPAISGQVYQVGEDVRQCFIRQDTKLEKAFQVDTNKPGSYLLDNARAAQLQLRSQGLDATQIARDSHCTFTDKERFFSYRRDGVNSGRMATLIWLDS